MNHDCQLLIGFLVGICVPLVPFIFPRKWFCGETDLFGLLIVACRNSKNFKWLAKPVLKEPNESDYLDRMQFRVSEFKKEQKISCKD